MYYIIIFLFLFFKVSKLRNSARSVQRTIVNNFMDSSKQEAIDLLLLNGYVGEIGIQTRNLLKPADLLGKRLNFICDLDSTAVH